MNNDSINSTNVQSSEGICLSYFSPSFHRIPMICIGFFTIELFLRLFSTPSLSMYFKKFMNWIDIIAVVPFYITNIINLVNQFGYQNINIYNSFALLRVLRCARIFKFYCVFKNIKTIRVLAVTVKESIYGDIVPVTALGRLTAVLCALTGVGTVGMLVSILVDRYQRVYTRKLYIKPEQIDFNEYSDEENEDLEMGHGNSCNDSLIVNIHDKQKQEKFNLTDQNKDIIPRYDTKISLLTSPSSSLTLLNGIDHSNSRHHFMNSYKSNNNEVSLTLPNEIKSIA
ncbi:unnamed protein product [Rotaria sp. Silwood2]|nr:unnamed protein product [Rotaria sp. Silwood2]